MECKYTAISKQFLYHSFEEFEKHFDLMLKCGFKPRFDSSSPNYYTNHNSNTYFAIYDKKVSNDYHIAKWLYRLESKNPNKGLWYNLNNEYVWNIGELANCKTKDLPMEYDERYHLDGKCWFSSCSKKEDLLHWYSLQDALELISNGFVFTRYLAVDFVEYENETTFIKETCLAREEIDIEQLFAN